MTAIQLRAELFREMSPLLDNESAMTKVIAFVKSIVVAQKTEVGVVPVKDGLLLPSKHTTTVKTS